MKRTSTFFSLLTLCAAASAQNLPVEDQLLEEEVNVPHYTVELIVFAYAENVSVGTELFLPDPPIIEDEDPLAFEDGLIDGEGPLPDDSVAEIIEDEAVDAEDLEALQRELPFVLLPEEEYTLIDISDRLERLDAYETLFHVSWTQPTYPDEDTLPIELHALGDVPAGLDGSFTLYLSRYLHLVVDLSLAAADQNLAAADDDDAFAEEPETTIIFGDSRMQDDLFTDAAGRELQARIVHYRLLENRIVKNGELRYFDHPKFGVIAKITRMEEVETDEDNEDDEDNPESINESRRLMSRIDQSISQ